MKSRKLFVVLPVAACLLLLVMACSTTHYKEKADAEVYPIIAEKSLEVPGSPQDFTIDQEQTLSLEGLPTMEREDETLGDTSPTENGAYILSLEKALSVAVKRSREYQSQKENLYESALALTLQRHRFDPIFAGRFSGDYNRTTRDVERPTDAALIARELPNILERTGDRADGGLKANDHWLDYASVTTTENFVLCAALAPGTSTLTNAASEPHVQEFCHFMALLGAQLAGIGHAGGRRPVVAAIDTARVLAQGHFHACRFLQDHFFY